MTFHPHQSRAIGAVSLSVPRRAFLTGGAAALALAGEAHADAPASLKALAARTGRVFGAAVSWKQLDDPDFAALVREQCAILTPEWEMKWGAVEATRYEPSYGPAVKIVNFADANGLQVRGHAALWANNLPPWGRNALLARGGDSAALTRLRQILQRFPDLADWDVANEALEPRNGRPDGLRNSALVTALGTNWIARSFFEARKYAPKSKLYYNEYGVDYADQQSEDRRTAVLRLLENLRKQNAPADGLGIQAHLRPGDKPFDAARYRAFLKDVAGLGFEIKITELDIDDKILGPDVASRDARVADETARYLDAALDEPAVMGVLCWGLSDRYSWLRRSKRFGRQDGVAARPLPFDDKMRPKPMYEAIARAFRAAPQSRSPR